MPKSDKGRRQETPGVITMSGHAYRPIFHRAEASQPYNVPRNVGNKPNLNAAKGAPMTDNKRAPFKSSSIFDK
jgi:hypothetical protein